MVGSQGGIAAKATTRAAVGDVHAGRRVAAARDGPLPSLVEMAASHASRARVRTEQRLAPRRAGVIAGHPVDVLA